MLEVPGGEKAPGQKGGSMKEKVIKALEEAARVVEVGGWDWERWVDTAEEILGGEAKLSLVFEGEEEAQTLFTIERPDDLGAWIRAECQDGTFYIWNYSDPQVFRVYTLEEAAEELKRLGG